jgi:hypothetical protein
MPESSAGGGGKAVAMGSTVLWLGTWKAFHFRVKKIRVRHILGTISAHVVGGASSSVVLGSRWLAEGEVKLVW